MTTRTDARGKGGDEVECRDGRFRTSDGVELGYRLGGNPSGPPLLFCYGLMCSSFHFKYLWEHLAARYRLLVLDYRAHHVSGSPKAITTLNFPRLADDFAEFLDEVGERRPVGVIGHSMGVNLALELYERHATRTASLVLISGAATFPSASRAAIDRIAFVGATMKVVDGLFPRIAEKLWRGPTTAPGANEFAGFVGFNTKLSRREDIGMVVRIMSRFRPSVFAQLLSQYLHHDRRATLPRVAVPTLIISGDSDKAVPPSYQEYLRDRIPGAKYVSIRDGSHCPQFDRPDTVNQAVAEFLESVAASRAANPRNGSAHLPRPGAADGVKVSYWSPGHSMRSGS